MDKAINLKRRRFLVSAGLGGAGAAAAVVAGKALIEPPPGSADKQEANTGYRLTEHVRNYYRTTRV